MDKYIRGLPKLKGKERKKLFGLSKRCGDPQIKLQNLSTE